MALLDLDYRVARDALLGYARATAIVPLPGRPQWTNWVVDPEGPESEHNLAPEDMPGLLYTVYKRSHDPVLVSALVDSVKFADGCMAETMSCILADLARYYPRALLTEMAHRDKSTWLWVSELAITEIELDKPPQKVFPRLVHIAATPGDPLRAAARRLLANMTRYQTEARHRIAQGRAAKEQKGR